MYVENSNVCMNGISKACVKYIYFYFFAFDSSAQLDNSVVALFAACPCLRMSASVSVSVFKCSYLELTLGSFVLCCLSSLSLMLPSECFSLSPVSIVLSKDVSKCILMLVFKFGSSWGGLIYLHAKSHGVCFIDYVLQSLWPWAHSGSCQYISSVSQVDKHL